MYQNKRRAFSKTVTGARVHRKQRKNAARVTAYFLEYLGDQLYYLGATIEREYKNTVRSIRHGVKKALLRVGRFFALIFTTLGRWILTIILDFINPFVKAFRSLRSLGIVLKSASKRGVKGFFIRMGNFFKYGWIWNKHLLGRFLNQLLPVAAAVGFVYVVFFMTNYNFALSVEYAGEEIGYIASEKEFDAAKDIIRERMIESSDMRWTTNVNLNIAVVRDEKLVSHRSIADGILSASGIGITKATGLYINNVFYGATVEGDKLGESLDNLLETQHAQIKDEENIVVSFVSDIELRDGVYPEESIRDVADIDKFIHSSKKAAVFYTVTEEDTIETITENTGIALEKLSRLNPDVELENLKSGDRILIAAEEPALAIRVTRTEVIVEEIPVEEEIHYDPKLPETYKKVYYSGENGFREVYYQIVYDDGVETSRTIIDENVVKNMVKKVVVKGTKRTVGFGGRPPTTSGLLGWPTGSYQFIGRGSGDGTYHIAVDIAAQMYTNIYAAESGRVVTSGWSDGGYGYYVVIDHGTIDGMSVSTLYGHNSENLVEVGDTVTKGQLIAYSGSTGNSTGPHLHFEVRVDGKQTPPEPWLGINIVPN